MAETHAYFVSIEKVGRTYRLVGRYSDEATALAVYRSQTWLVSFLPDFDRVSLDRVTYADGVVAGREVIETYGKAG
jgi:hypothetical protein